MSIGPPRDDPSRSIHHGVAPRPICQIVGGDRCITPRSEFAIFPFPFNRADGAVLVSWSPQREKSEVGRSHACGRPMHGFREGLAMTDVTKGFRDGRFVSVAERDRRDLLKLMARVAEQAYRRGAQQGAGLAHRPSFRADLGAWRYTPGLDLSPWIDSPRVTTSLERTRGRVRRRPVQTRALAQ